MSTSTQSIKAVFIIIFSATLAWGQRCDPTQLPLCLQRYATGMTDYWPSNGGELQKKCTDFSNLVDCFKGSLENCNEDIKRLFKGLENFKTEVCEINSPISKGYIQHSGCMNNVLAEMLHCIRSNVPQSSNPCSNVHYIAQCSDKIYGARCGADANQLAKKSLGITFQMTCPEEVKEYLSSASSLKYSVISAFLLPAAMLLMRFWREEM